MSSPVVPKLMNLTRLTILNESLYLDSPNQAKCKLFKNDVEPDENMTPATFVEADFSTYAEVDLTMLAPTLNDQGMAVTKSNLCNFTTPEGEPEQVIYGVYITDALGTVIIAAQRFDEPQSMGGVFPQAITGVWRYSDPLTNYGWVDVEA